MQWIEASEFDRLLSDGVPLIDVRAPVECTKGAFPDSVNLPLLEDSEREKVGTAYKQQGKEAAIALGHQLVCGEVKRERVAKWQRFIENNPDAVLYCFRGGLRSRIACQWITEAGLEIKAVKGGYKALRRHLLNVFDGLTPTGFVLLSGMTGCGKTPLIHTYKNSIDLEGIANHRGSSFGKQLTPQPAQIDFENQLAIELIKARQKDFILLEDESRLIGKNFLPLPLQEVMRQCPIVIVDEPVDNRVERILQEYVVDMLAALQAQDGETAAQRLEDYLTTALLSLKKRLGIKALLILQQRQRDAIKQQLANNDVSLHRQWIQLLLEEYYDPMYRYQLSKKAERIIYRGDWHRVKEYLQSSQFADEFKQALAAG